VEGHLVLALLISARGICWGKLFIFSKTTLGERGGLKKDE
jgi:hypothetical protein